MENLKDFFQPRGRYVPSDLIRIVNSFYLYRPGIIVTGTGRGLFRKLQTFKTVADCQDSCRLRKQFLNVKTIADSCKLTIPLNIAAANGIANMSVINRPGVARAVQ